MIPHSVPTLGCEEEHAAAAVLRSGHISQGAEVEAFEEECAAALGRKYAVALNSGTSALHLALGALQVPQSGLVAIPSYVCAALATAVSLHGATVALCDIGPDYNLDPHSVPEQAFAVIVPHLFGAPASVPEGFVVIEDIAQSIGGATGRKGAVCVASFYATKLMTTGEGGMLLTNDGSVAEYVRDRRDYDNRDTFLTRYNYKMTDLQAAIGRVQLRRLPEFIARRRAIAERYSSAFRSLPIVLPDPEGHVFFRYVVAVEDRDLFEKHVREQGIDAKRPVYRPMHHYFGGCFPVSESAHSSCVSLPIYPSLSDINVGRVIEAVESFFPE